MRSRTPAQRARIATPHASIVSPARYERDVGTVERALSRMPLGGRMVTYHGFGGRIPGSFECKAEEDLETGVLRLWVKERRRSAERTFHVEETELALHDLQFADV